MISEGIDELMEVLSQYGPPTKALIPFRGTIQVNNKICPKDAKLLRNRIDFVPQSEMRYLTLIDNAQEVGEFNLKNDGNPKMVDGRWDLLNPKVQNFHTIDYSSSL